MLTCSTFSFPNFGQAIDLLCAVCYLAALMIGQNTRRSSSPNWPNVRFSLPDHPACCNTTIPCACCNSTCWTRNYLRLYGFCSLGWRWRRRWAWCEWWLLWWARAIESLRWGRVHRETFRAALSPKQPAMERLVIGLRCAKWARISIRSRSGTFCLELKSIIIIVRNVSINSNLIVVLKKTYLFNCIEI